MDIIEWLYNGYESLPWAVQVLVNFGFFHIFIRGIIANEITAELRKYEPFKDGFIHGVIKFVKGKWNAYWSNPRRSAIKSHYVNEHGEKITLCKQELCANL